MKTIFPLCQRLLNYASRVPWREARRQEVREEISASSLIFSCWNHSSEGPSYENSNWLQFLSFLPANPRISISYPLEVPVAAWL